MPRKLKSGDDSQQIPDKAVLPSDPQPDASDLPADSPLIYISDQLFRGNREIWIEHGEVQYRLRITSSGKLILTK